MSEYILDASALLAILNQEPATDSWARAATSAAISAVNLSEVVGKLTDVSMTEPKIGAVLGPLGLDVVPFDQDLAYVAGLLRAETKEFGLSLGDRACLALGKRLGLPILTADRAWARLHLGMEIRVIR